MFALLCASHVVSAKLTCSEDAACHYQSCDAKARAIDHVASHNRSSLVCTHPFVASVATDSHYLPDERAAHAAARSACPHLLTSRPTCEDTRVKSELDTLLLSIFVTQVCMHVAKWLV